jgi:hypothetical protein
MTPKRRQQAIVRWLGQSLSDAPVRLTGASPGRNPFKLVTVPTGQALPQPPTREGVG